MTHKEELIAQAQDLKARGKSVAEIAELLQIEEHEVRQVLINWRQNCLTSGPHDGRPESLWSMPLLQTTYMFSPVMIQELVVARIYADAIQMVEFGLEPRMPQEWAELTKEIAAERVLPVYQQKIGEITRYYQSDSCRRDILGAIQFYKDGALNTRYQPLHDHDSLNLLCRIVGQGASIKAAKKVGR